MRGVIDPRKAEENFAMLGHPLEECHVRQCASSDSGSKQTPKVVVVPGDAKFPGFVGRSESFLVEEAGFFPENALRQRGLELKTVPPFDQLPCLRL